MSTKGNRKLLIVSADDFGLCRSVNHASIEAYRRGCVRSLSIMAPAPNFEEAVRLAKKNKISGVGVHLTLISEFSKWRWCPASSKNRVKSLIDRVGFFHASIEEFSGHAKAGEVAFELENQIEKVIGSGIQPTHLDCHMFALHHQVSRRTDLVPIIFYLCRKYRLPFRAPFRRESVYLKRRGVKVLSSCPWHTYDVPAEKKEQEYGKILKGIRLGVTELILHCGYDDADLGRVTSQGARRQADFNYAVSPATNEEVISNNIKLSPWKEALALMD